MKNDLAEISAAMIVKNEEQNLMRCLESIRPVVEEIVVIDCGSSDRTRDIAGGYGKVYDFPWTDDFSAARNFSLSKATKEIIFFIDADEAVSSKDYHSVNSIKKMDPSAIWGLSIVTRNYFWDDVLDINYARNRGEYPEMEEGARGYIPSDKVRFFPRTPKIFFENRIHETVEKSIYKSSGRVTDKYVPVIHHFGYLSDKASNKEKQEKYGILLEKEAEASPRSDKAQFDYAYHLFITEKYSEAFTRFLKAYSLNKRFEYIFYLGLASLKTGNPRQALRYFGEIKKRENPALTYYLALAHAESGETGKAISLLRSAVKRFPENPHMLQILGESYLKEGKDNLAKMYLEKAKKLALEKD
jgi:O-antigen biosynthesis protein